MAKDIYARSVAHKALKNGAGGGTPAPHTHAAADITSGTLDQARIPTLAQSKVTNLTTDLGAKIAKSSVSGIAAIGTPASATPEEIATKVNALIAALKA